MWARLMVRAVRAHDLRRYRDLEQERHSVPRVTPPAVPKLGGYRIARLLAASREQSLADPSRDKEKTTGVRRNGVTAKRALFAGSSRRSGCGAKRRVD